MLYFASFQQQQSKNFYYSYKFKERNFKKLFSRWHQDKKVRKQLESLANRLQLTTPLPNTPNYSTTNEKNGSIRSTTSRRSKLSDSCFDNPVFHPQESSPIDGLVYPSDSEFNASIFGLNPSLYIGPPVQSEPICKFFFKNLSLKF